MAKKPLPKDFFLTFVEPEYLTSIGLVITQWSLLEAMIENAIWQAARLSVGGGWALTSQTQMMGKLDMLGALLELNYPQFAPQYRKVASYIRDCLQGQRNLVAHGFWISDQENGSTFAMKIGARGKLTSHSRTVDIKELTALASDISETSVWIIRLSDALPEVRKRRGEPTHEIPKIQSNRDCAILKQQALQPLVVPRSK